jgi:hypothetical protein
MTSAILRSLRGLRVLSLPRGLPRRDDRGDVLDLDPAALHVPEDAAGGDGGGGLVVDEGDGGVVAAAGEGGAVGGVVVDEVAGQGLGAALEAR